MTRARAVTYGIHALLAAIVFLAGCATSPVGAGGAKPSDIWPENGVPVSVGVQDVEPGDVAKVEMEFKEVTGGIVTMSYEVASGANWYSVLPSAPMVVWTQSSPSVLYLSTSSSAKPGTKVKVSVTSKGVTKSDSFTFLKP